MSTSLANHSEPWRRHQHLWVLAALLAVISFAGAVRIRLLAVPLERDEGEYAYAGQLILQGVAPYAQAYNMKMPGIYAAYALIMAAFGQTHTGIHLGLLIVNIGTILALYLLTRQLCGSLAGIIAAAAYAMLSLGQRVLGITANAEHFVVLAAVGGTAVLLRASKGKKWLIAPGAVLLGTAFVIKQHGAAFAVFGGLYLFFCELRRRPFVWKEFVGRGVLFWAGVLLPFAATCVVLWRCGVFEKFWFWTFEYARQYVSIVPLHRGYAIFKEEITQIVSSAILVWLLAGIGLTGLLWNRKLRGCRYFILGFLVFSFLAICPGFYFRAHYFILLLPAVSLLVGVGAICIYDLFADAGEGLQIKAIPILVVVLALLHGVYQQHRLFFAASVNAASRALYGMNPFPESLEIARFIKARSDRNDSIAVIGSEPQIYFYSNRRSATGYMYSYALMEEHSYAVQMQEEMIREIERARPKFLVFVNIPTSWLMQPNSERKIFEWFDQYQHIDYRKVGIIDILSMRHTIYRWDGDCEGYEPHSPYWLSVFERKSEEDKDEPAALTKNGRFDRFKFDIAKNYSTTEKPL